MSDAKISALAALTGANVDAVADVLAVVDTSATTTKKITIDEALLAMLASTTNARFKVGSFTRDQTTASGTQAITGVGFKLKSVIFIAGETGTTKGSIGVDDGTNSGVLFHNVPAGVSFFNIQAGASIFLTDTAGATYSGVISATGTDGFTITFTKSGSPTGTATIAYLASR